MITEKIPNNKNLTIQEIMEYVTEIDNKILDAMEKTIPKIKKKKFGQLLHKWKNIKITKGKE